VTLRAICAILLAIVGLILLTVAAWMVTPALGVAVAGMSCLLAEWRLVGD
jgi:hypothetical protein